MLIPNDAFKHAGRERQARVRHSVAARVIPVIYVRPETLPGFPAPAR